MHRLTHIHTHTHAQNKTRYEQAGTPEVKVEGEYNDKTKTFTLHLTQVLCHNLLFHGIFFGNCVNLCVCYVLVEKHECF